MPRDPGQLDRLRASHRGSVGTLRGKLDGVKRELDRIESIDYLKSPAGERARTLWETTAKRLRTVETRPRAASIRRPGALPPRGSTWVTRPRPHIDRIASAWLIKRFCDPDARFTSRTPPTPIARAFRSTSSAPSSAHHAEDCTFETLVKRFGLKDRRVRLIAEIVHEADLHDDKFTRNEAPGVDLAIRALAEATPDDDELLTRGMAMFDGLYAVLKSKT